MGKKEGEEEGASDGAREGLNVRLTPGGRGTIGAGALVGTERGRMKGSTVGSADGFELG